MQPFKFNVVTEEIPGENDLLNDRVFVIGDGTNNIHVVKKSPYDMWEIRYEHGEVPNKLKGMWTTFSDAKKAVVKHFHEKKIDINEIII